MPLPSDVLYHRAWEKSKRYIPATHQETNCRLVSYENEISRPNATACGVRPCESDFEVLLARREVCSSRWQEHFSLSTHIPLSPSYSSAPSRLFFFIPFFSFTCTSSHFQSFVCVCATTLRKISLTFSRIARSSLEYQMSNTHLR